MTPYTVTTNQSDPESKEQAVPSLSILIPFYKDDPRGLITALAAQARSDVEILVYDDGTGDSALTERVKACVEQSSPSNVSLITAHENKGRSAARNYLQAYSKSDWVLFLDADMRPQSTDFIDQYLALTALGHADIIFGGFTVLKTSESPDRELHRALSEVSDCLDAQARQIAGPQYVATSNLCVRKTVLETETFDPDFVGWGWEDSEWAARVAQKFTLVHADIPAIHLGLETTDTLLSRFRDSAQNYVRFTNKHPDLAKTLTLYTTAYKIKKIPGQAIMRPILQGLVKINATPIKLRLLALKLWRASWYAEALP